MQNPAEQLKNVPLTILLPDLLSQFNKPTLLGKRGVKLTKSQMDTIALALENGPSLPEETPAICDALRDIVDESASELQDRFGLSFAQALKIIDISKVADWKTTADFLEIANIKSNAELRISAGTSLMIFLGDVSRVAHLFTVITVDDGANDVDAMIARRALSTHTGISMDTEDWLAKIHEKLSPT